jgi:hypothetical protein
MDILPGFTHFQPLTVDPKFVFCFLFVAFWCKNERIRTSQGFDRVLLRTGTGRAMKTIEAPPTMIMRVPSDLFSAQLLKRPFRSLIS